MALWDLLVGVCFFIAVLGALHSAELAGVGFWGHALAIVTGLAIGTCCACAMRTVGEIVGARASKLRSKSLRRWCFRGLYPSTVFWILLSLGIGTRVTSALIRLVI